MRALGIGEVDLRPVAGGGRDGAALLTIYLATDRETVLERVRARRNGDADDFVLPEDLAGQYFDHFEVPTPDEGPLTVVRQER